MSCLNDNCLLGLIMFSGLIYSVIGVIIGYMLASMQNSKIYVFKNDFVEE
jgi:hypothetical protein